MIYTKVGELYCGEILLPFDPGDVDSRFWQKKKKEKYGFKFYISTLFLVVFISGWLL